MQRIIESKLQIHIYEYEVKFIEGKFTIDGVLASEFIKRLSPSIIERCNKKGFDIVKFSKIGM